MILNGNLHLRFGLRNKLSHMTCWTSHFMFETRNWNIIASPFVIWIYCANRNNNAVGWFVNCRRDELFFFSPFIFFDGIIKNDSSFVLCAHISNEEFYRTYRMRKKNWLHFECLNGIYLNRNKKKHIAMTKVTCNANFIRRVIVFNLMSNKIKLCGEICSAFHTKNICAIPHSKSLLEHISWKIYHICVWIIMFGIGIGIW